MGSNVRILHLADTHIGAELPRRPRVDRPRRGDDFIGSYRRLLARAAADGVDLVIHAGDVFDIPDPSAGAVSAAAEPLLDLAAAGTPVVIVPGNHERSSIPASLLLAHPNIHIVDRPRTVAFNLDGRRVAVSAVPCVRRDAARRFPEAIRATNWHSTNADLRILACHQTFESARCGPAGYRFRTGDDVVERDAVPAAFDYVAAGHIHRHQALASPHDGGPPIVYAGSPDRISFAERDEPKGGVYVEMNGGAPSWRFVEHEVRPMSVVTINVTGLTISGVRDAVAETIEPLASDAVSLVRLSGRAGADRLRGLGLASLVRELKPDALIKVASRGVDFRPASPERPPSASKSASTAPKAQSVLTGGRGQRAIRVAADQCGDLPNECGVYALHDAKQRLLYIGKTKNIRTRVQTHVRGATGKAHLDGWAEQIARIDARVASSELEALLREADLIRTHRPPFNRQMRSWSRYCYICESGEPFGQLQVSDQLVAGRRCYGPVRGRHIANTVIEATAAVLQLAHCPVDEVTSQATTEIHGGNLCARYFDGVCGGPCAGRIDDRESQRRMKQRRDLLTGRDDSALETLQRHIETNRGATGSTASRDRRRLAALEAAFAHGCLLRDAESMLNGLLILPGSTRSRTVVIPTRRGVCFDTMTDGQPSAERVLKRHQRVTDRPAAGQRLSKVIVDALTVAVHHLRRHPESCVHIASDEATRMTPARLHGIAFQVAESSEAPLSP